MFTKINIAMGTECNLHCRYCMQNNSISTKHSKFTDEMINFVNNDNAKNITLFGGEPLLYFDDIRYFFDRYTGKANRSIITNGTMLNNDIVNYINEQKITFVLSHHGEITKSLCGIDILENSAYIRLLNKLDRLMVNSIITNKNIDVNEIVSYAKKKGLKDEFSFVANSLVTTGCEKSLYNHFNYELYKDNLIRFFENPQHRKQSTSMISRYLNIIRSKNFSRVLTIAPDGNIFYNFSYKKYGHISDKTMDLYAYSLRRDNELRCSYCAFKSVCYYCKAGKHTCLCEQTKLLAVFRFLTSRGYIRLENELNEKSCTIVREKM